MFIKLLTIKDTMASGMNLWTPPAFGQMLSVWKGRLQKSNQVLKKYVTCEKFKIFEVQCMKEKLVSAPFLLFNIAMPTHSVNSF